MPGVTTAQMIEALLGVETYPQENPLTGTALTTVTRIAPGDPQRASLLIVNLGANTVYVAPTNLVAADHGILLAANGGSMSMIWDRDFQQVTAEWYAIAAGANSDIYVLQSRIVA